MVSNGLRGDVLEKAFIDELIERYRLSEYDLPTLTLMLLDVPHLDVSEFLHRSVSHKERWQAFQKIKRNRTLPKDGIGRLEELYLGYKCNGHNPGGKEKCLLQDNGSNDRASLFLVSKKRGKPIE